MEVSSSSIADTSEIGPDVIATALNNVIWGVHGAWFCRVAQPPPLHVLVLRETDQLDDDSLPPRLKVVVEASAEAIVLAMPPWVYAVYLAQTQPASEGVERAEGGAWCLDVVVAMKDEWRALVGNRPGGSTATHAILGGLGRWDQWRVSVDRRWEYWDETCVE
eukprot:CAMPEP_0113671658 /NCGR_PEP_ID=MMETSP0038_2-20120614/5824_1 /TAXON_ID=2898 /ORGANISM="Cryptomonas paramecium" /LENGTH=162 /DNA_ID=CAMNT_0000587829 /DNA_START=273 /DNA_END=761 /DNA_ORIENTATION=- /assembly_acc=CAM_ASM_000170